MEPTDDISAVCEALDMLGGDSAVARLLGVRPWAISKWRKKLPLDRVLWLAAETGWRFSPHMLAPALYPHPDDGLPIELRPSSRSCPPARRSGEGATADGEMEGAIA